jgi:hypothetical protein
LGGLERERIQDQPELCSETLSQKKKKTLKTVLWTGGEAQAVEYLLCNCEAKSSNRSLTITTKKSIKKVYDSSLHSSHYKQFSI